MANEALTPKLFQNSVELGGMLLKLFNQKYNIHNTRHGRPLKWVWLLCFQVCVKVPKLT